MDNYVILLEHIIINTVTVIFSRLVRCLLLERLAYSTSAALCGPPIVTNDMWTSVTVGCVLNATSA